MQAGNGDVKVVQIAVDSEREVVFALDSTGQIWIRSREAPGAPFTWSALEGPLDG